MLTQILINATALISIFKYYQHPHIRISVSLKMQRHANLALDPVSKDCGEWLSAPGGEFRDIKKKKDQIQEIKI